MHQQLLAGLGQQDLLAQPVQKTTAHIGFQRFHGMTDRRLGEEQFAGRLSETARASQNDKRVELSTVEGRIHS